MPQVNGVDYARCKKCEESGMVCSPLLDQLWCSRCNDSAVQPCSLIEEFKRWNAKRVLGISDEEYDELQQKDTTERQNKTISAPSLRGRKPAKSLANKVYGFVAALTMTTEYCYCGVSRIPIPYNLLQPPQTLNFHFQLLVSRHPPRQYVHTPLLRLRRSASWSHRSPLSKLVLRYQRRRITLIEDSLRGQ